MTEDSEQTITPARVRVRGLPAAIWRAALGGVWDRHSTEHVGLIAAGVAFFGMLALFPAIGAVISVWGYFWDPAVARDLLAEMQGVLPDDAIALIDGQLVALIDAGTVRLGWASALSLVIAIWSARSGTGALVQGLNAIHRCPIRHSLWHTVMALFLTLVLVGTALVALTTVVIVPIAVGLLPPTPATGWLIEGARWIASIGALVIGLAILYRFGPNRRSRRMPWITPGLVSVVLLWIAMSAAFSVYIADFGRYTQVYGSIGAVVATLVWLYLSAYLVLLGALLDAELIRAADDAA